MNKVVLITGESRGFGLEIAKLFLKDKNIVCGISRNDFSYDGIYHQVGDVTNINDCKRCVDNIIEKYGRIDILVNNAGFGIFSPVEEISIDDAKKQFEVSFFAAFYLAKLVIPYMRNCKKGLIVNISSIASLIPLPFQAFYSASKASLDMLFSALRVELYPYNIKITSVLPGDSKTGFTSNRKTTISERSIYFERVERGLKTVSKDEENGFDPKKVAKKVFVLSKKKNPPYRVLVGGKDKLLRCLYVVLPKRLRNYLLYKIYAK